MNVYLVGGAVRDRLLGLPSTDKDWVVVDTLPEKLIDQGFKQVGKDFPVFLHPKTQEEYALARVERKQGRGHHGFYVDYSTSVTLEQDLERRDLTINAIAQDENGEIIDPYHGVSDLNAKILRHISPAFAEDPLRVLRVARFAARFHHLNFTIAPETLTLMRSITSKNELQTLSAERIWLETQKALQTSSPWIYFQVLQKCGALDILFPEIHALYARPNSLPHFENLAEQSFATLKNAVLLTHNIEVRFAALCHAIGRQTPPDLNTINIEKSASVQTAISQLTTRLKLPLYIQQALQIGCQFYVCFRQITQFNAEDYLQLFAALDAFRQKAYLALFLSIASAEAMLDTSLQQCEKRAHYITELYNLCANVAIKPILEAGFVGADIKHELYKQRLICASNYLNSAPLSAQ